MHLDQAPYRRLHDAVLDRDGGRFPSKDLSDWLARQHQEVEWLASFRARTGPGIPATEEELWRLYALSRVLEVMLLSFQPAGPGGSTLLGPAIPAEELHDFVGRLGLSVHVPPRYSPFDCEIVEATESSDPLEPPSVVHVHWPCLMLGDMLVCRAGATIRAGTSVITPNVATTSTLYWAYRRRNRPHQDLSFGWGSNSQWRTSFRRDYRVGDRCFYNVDGTQDLSAELVPGRSTVTLTRSERIELLVNRCFVVTEKPSDDLWPYRDRFTSNDLAPSPGPPGPVSGHG